MSEDARKVLISDLDLHRFELPNYKRRRTMANLRQDVHVLVAEVRSARRARDEARARVAALEAGLRDAERTLALYDSRLPLWDHARVELQAIRALLVPSTGQETDGV